MSFEGTAHLQLAPIRVPPRPAPAPQKIGVPRVSLDAARSSEKTLDSRRMVLEAVVVRIMKARKALPHAQLVAEVMKQVSASLFEPDPQMVRGRCVATDGSGALCVCV